MPAGPESAGTVSMSAPSPARARASDRDQTTTVCPTRWRAGTSARPMKPVAPVMRMRMDQSYATRLMAYALRLTAYAPRRAEALRYLSTLLR